VTATPGAARASESHSAERWFLRIDGHHYGPVGRAELERFLLPPRLCSVMEVKCGDEGVWFSIARNETIDKVLVRAGIAPEPGPQTLWQRPESSALSRLLGGIGAVFSGLAAWLLERWAATAVVFTLLAINAVGLFVLRDPYTRDREILARFETVWRDVGAFDAKKTSSDDWRSFAGPILAELEPIIRELEGSASVHEPARQNLLFAGRDNLKRILRKEKPPAPRDPQVVMFEKRLRFARQQFSDGAAEPTSSPVAKGAP
jgi:hypothetical protein